MSKAREAGHLSMPNRMTPPSAARLWSATALSTRTDCQSQLSVRQSGLGPIQSTRAPAYPGPWCPGVRAWDPGPRPGPGCTRVPNTRYQESCTNTWSLGQTFRPLPGGSRPTRPLPPPKLPGEGVPVSTPSTAGGAGRGKLPEESGRYGKWCPLMDQVLVNFSLPRRSTNTITIDN